MGCTESLAFRENRVQKEVIDKLMEKVWHSVRINDKLEARGIIFSELVAW